MINRKNILNDNLFTIATSRPGINIVYAPLQGYAFLCDDPNISDVQKFIEYGQLQPGTKVSNNILKLLSQDVNMPDETAPIDLEDRLVIILSQMCNLACTYCFAQESRSSAVLDSRILEIAIDYIFNKGKTNKMFTFIGGGEPFVTWPLLKQGIEYIDYSAKKHCKSYSISIITNATLIDKNKAAFLSKYHLTLSLSFDILPDIQNKQRPFFSSIKSTYEQVVKSIAFLEDYGINYGFRGTVTPLNVARLPEMVEYCIANFPQIKRLHFEPVTDNGISEEFYDQYVENFIKAFEIGDSYGVFVTNSFINSYYKIKYRFCQGELCLTPTGEIVACHRHSSVEDTAFSLFKIGEITNSVIIDNDRFRAVCALWNHQSQKCDRCFAKWHCAGKCTSIHSSMSIADNNNHCNFVRTLISRYLEYQLTK